MFDVAQFSLKGKVAVITGGGRGIGQAIAFAFAKAGAKVVITSRKAQDLEATADEIKAFGGEAFPLPAHLGKADEIKRMIDTVMKKFGRIDILVNNAGASPAMGTVLECDDRLWDKLMDINLKGAYFVSQAAANVMVKQGGGKIINIASASSFKPLVGMAAYSAAKAGVVMMTKTLALELARYNVQANTLSPGYFITPLNKDFFDSESGKKMISIWPPRRPGNLDELRGIIVYLASPSSSYTTGTEMIIDGGQWL